MPIVKMTVIIHQNAKGKICDVMPTDKFVSLSTEKVQKVFKIDFELVVEKHKGHKVNNKVGIHQSYIQS